MGDNKRPNIIMMIADDQRHDTIHALGNEHIQTPHLDALVQRGAAFRQTYITGGLTPAVCVPSRACIHTGAHTLNALQGRMLNRWPDLMTLNTECAVLPQVMRESGYH